MATSNVFTSDKVSFELLEMNNRGVRCRLPIDAGEILVQEHCFASREPDSLANVVMYSPQLFDQLFPRGAATWNIDDDLSELATEKAQKNMFSWNDYFILGCSVCLWNHSPTPNAQPWVTTVETELDVPILICAILAVRPIAVGEEITIWYGNAYFAEDRATPTFDPPSNDIQQALKRRVRSYLSDWHWKTVTFQHICIFHGMYIPNHDILCPTPRFITFFEETFHIEFSLEQFHRFVDAVYAKLNDEQRRWRNTWHRVVFL